MRKSRDVDQYVRTDTGRGCFVLRPRVRWPLIARAVCFDDGSCEEKDVYQKVTEYYDEVCEHGVGGGCMCSKLLFAGEVFQEAGAHDATQVGDLLHLHSTWLAWRVPAPLSSRCAQVPMWVAVKPRVSEGSEHPPYWPPLGAPRRVSGAL